MRNSVEVKRQIKKVFTPFSKQYGFRFYKPTLLLRENSNILHIINFDMGSIGFTCIIAIQPLFILSEVIDLSFGSRISKFKINLKDWWSYDEPKKGLLEIKKLLEKNAMCWFDNVGNPEGIIEYLGDKQQKYLREIIGFPPASRSMYLGYTYLYLNMYDKAQKELKAVLKSCEEDTRDWVIEEQNRVKEIMLLVQNEPEKIKSKLDNNIIESKNIFKLSNVN